MEKTWETWWWNEEVVTLINKIGSRTSHKELRKCICQKSTGERSETTKLAGAR